MECSVLQATPLPPSLLFPRSLPPSSVVVHLFDYAQFSAAVERLLTLGRRGPEQETDLARQGSGSA